VKATLLAFAGCAASVASTLAGDDPSLFRVPFERGSNSPPVVSVFYDLDYSGIGREQPETVITCIWADGRIVWSRDRTKGGAPYFTAHIAPKRLTKFLASLDAKCLFARKVSFMQAVDSPHHDINIIDGERRLVLVSSSDYVHASKTPNCITELSDAMPYVRQQLERLLPRQGVPMPNFNYDLRRVPH
jgi:hypothetical protein